MQAHCDPARVPLSVSCNSERPPGNCFWLHWEGDPLLHPAPCPPLHCNKTCAIQLGVSSCFRHCLLTHGLVCLLLILWHWLQLTRLFNMQYAVMAWLLCIAKCTWIIAGNEISFLEWHFQWWFCVTFTAIGALWLCQVCDTCSRQCWLLKMSSCKVSSRIKVLWKIFWWSKASYPTREWKHLLLR